LTPHTARCPASSVTISAESQLEKVRTNQESGTYSSDVLYTVKEANEEASGREDVRKVIERYAYIY